MDYTGERQVHTCFSKVDEDHTTRYCFAATLVRPGDQVADIGCGIGYGSGFLSFATECDHVTGIDISEESIAYAKKTLSSQIFSLVI